MIATGVKYLLNSLTEIDMALLERINEEAYNGIFRETKSAANLCNISKNE